MAKGTLNRIILIGNIGAEPETRGTPTGTVITELRIATTERRKNGEAWEDHTEWHRVTLFGRNAEFARDYCQKGNKVLIEGSMRTHKWQDKDGQDRYDYKINVSDFQMLGGGKQEGQQARPAQAPRRNTGRQAPADSGTAEDFSDDLPF